MSFKTTEEIQRLFAQFVRDTLADLPPEERSRYQEQFRQRADELLRAAADGSGGNQFLDLIGLDSKGPMPFQDLSIAHIESDFDDAVIQSQLHAAAELYFILQHERMKVFQVVNVLLRLFHDGRIRIQRGPGARALY